MKKNFQPLITYHRRSVTNLNAILLDKSRISITFHFKFIFQVLARKLYCEHLKKNNLKLIGRASIDKKNK